jgi:hypothetical protein
VNPDQPNTNEGTSSEQDGVKKPKNYSKAEADKIRADFAAEMAKWIEYDANGKEKTFFDYSKEELEQMPPERSTLLYAKAAFKDLK